VPGRRGCDCSKIDKNCSSPETCCNRRTLWARATMSKITAESESPPSLFGKVIQVSAQVKLRRGKSYEMVGNSIVKSNSLTP